MQHPPKFFVRATLRAVFCVATLCAAGAVHAQSGPYVGGGLGSTDGFGTALRVFGGAPITGMVGWEASATSYGKGRHGPGGVWERRATQFGVSLLAQLPLAAAWSATGKVGLHHVSYKDSRPGVSDSGLEPGLSLGLKWQFSPKAAARFEFEHIGGEAGELLTAGVQVHF
jgi:hypothetical protein